MIPLAVPFVTAMGGCAVGGLAAKTFVAVRESTSSIPWRPTEFKRSQAGHPASCFLSRTVMPMRVPKPGAEESTNQKPSFRLLLFQRAAPEY